MKCEICGKEILRDSQCINYKYYHNDCIENLQQGIKHLDEVNCKLRRKIGQLEDNWNKLKEYLINDLNDRNGYKVAEYEDGSKVSETISPIYTLMEDKSKTMKEILDKMQELQGSDNQ